MVYSIGGIKGGSGKSTIATNFAIMLSQAKKDVLLVDADDQTTAAYFTEFRNRTQNGNIGYTLIKLSGQSVRDQVLRIKEKYDDVIIDVGGRDTTSQRAAISVSDIYLVPFVPRSFDIWTLQNVVDLIKEVKVFNPTLRSYCFLNRADSRGTDNHDVERFLKQDTELVYIEAPIGQRKAFSNASSQGLGITEVKPTDSKAIEELKN